MSNFRNAIILLNSFGIIAARVIPTVHACQDREMILGSDINMAKAVDAPFPVTVRLECRFCNEKHDLIPKIWYYRQRGCKTTAKEVDIGMDSDAELNKISVTPFHTLVIKNFSSNDIGVYTCKHLELKEYSVFTYFVDTVFEDNIPPKTGKIHHYKEYKRMKLDPTNDLFITSNISDFVYLRENFNFTFRIKTIWQQWGPCESYSNEKRQSLRRRLGKCRLHPLRVINFNEPTELTDYENNVRDLTEYYFMDNFDVPCRSKMFFTCFPEISSLVRNIPEFEQIENCHGIGSPSHGAQLVKKTSYKYKTTEKIQENSHLTLSCPEVLMDSSVEWFKDGKLLNSSYRLIFYMAYVFSTSRIV